MSHELAMQSARDHSRAEARRELAEAMLRIIEGMEEGKQPTEYILEQTKYHLDTVVTVETLWLQNG